MKDYDYYRDAWPQIVRDTFAHGATMTVYENNNTAKENHD